MTDTMIKTGNAVPSADPRDRHDNSIALDLAMQSKEDTYVDRQNQVRRTLHWMEKASDGVLAIQAAKIAEQARDAAMLASGLFGTVAEGLAGTTSGKYFSVPASTDGLFITLYKNNAGAALAIETYPSAAAVKKIFDLVDEITGDGNVAFSFQDQSGFVLMKILVDGAMDLLKSKIEQSDFGGLELTDEYGFLYATFDPRDTMLAGLPLTNDPSFDGIEWADENGFVVGKVTNGGAFFGDQSKDEPEPDVKPLYLSLDGQVRTDIMQVMYYGQSLSMGASSLPPISTSQPYKNIMFKGGVSARPQHPYYDASEFVPMVAMSMPGGVDGEAPAIGMCNGIVRRMIDEEGASADDWVFAAVAPGRGGTGVAGLSKPPLGTFGVYEGMLKTVGDAKALADAAGKTYSLWAIAWAQGEHDSSPAVNTSRYAYSEQMSNLLDDMQRDIAAITGQRNAPYMFTSQMNGNRSSGRNNMWIAQAQWSLSRTRPDVVMVCPNYIFGRVEDGLHLTNYGSWLIGEYHARAMKHTMVSKNGKWRPLEPVSVDWTDAYIDVKYHVPAGKLAIDNALCDMTQNSGFDLYAAADRNAPLAIVSTVEVRGLDTIRINLTAPAPQSAYLTYAMGRAGNKSGPIIGARGNVRDTAGDFDKVTSPDMVEYALHNPAVAFEYSRKTGF